MPRILEPPEVVGLTGSFGSGCTTFADVLSKEAGYTVLNIGDLYIRPYAEQLGFDWKGEGRRALQIAGNMYRLDNGYDALAGLLLEDYLHDLGEPSASYLSLRTLESAGADIEGLELEELDLGTIKNRIEKDLQEAREMMEELYAASWDRAMGEP